MRSFLLPCLAIGLFTIQPVNAQNIPGETVGDTGWIEYGPEDTLILVRAADGHVWFQQNLGSDVVAGAATGPAAYGDLFQWGRWDDGHADPGSTNAQASTLSPNNPLGLGSGSPLFYMGPSPTDWWSAGDGTDTWTGSTASATNGIDPCAALGIGWQLPSKTDWIDVIAAEGITNTATALGSNLHLPAAGHRNGETGTLINTGLYGQYWSSTASGPYAKDLTVGDTWVNADDDAYRSHGMCVRCLNKDLHVGVRETGHGTGLRLHPNPSTGTFTVSSDIRLDRISLYGADMRLIGTWIPSAPSVALTPGLLSDGLYWVRTSCANGDRWLPLVIDQH